ncbi:MAG: C40 family peptidase [Rhizomicrobium sp.]|jgi:cell wall-associated NlpC family hydrolase
MDPRTTPARPDLAAAHLQGKVEAARFVHGKTSSVARGRASLKHAPSHQAVQDSELLYGETFIVYENRDGWAWGQAVFDSYVGYVHAVALQDVTVPTHRVVALMTPVFAAPDFKRPMCDMLPMNARVAVQARDKGYAAIAPNAYVWERHLEPLETKAEDWVAVAERFLGAPYVWSGKTHAGLDCSGLIQTALQAAGIAAPRDTDMQERALGFAVAPDDLRRGDLVFWKGHMGVMLDTSRLLHANSFHMEVAIEPLAEAVARIAQTAGAITSVKRIASSE